MTSVWWLRRDLRLRDQPALLAAADEGPVTALFVLDDALRNPAGAPRLAFLYRTLRELSRELRAAGGHLVIRHGAPQEVLCEVAREVRASAVHVSADFSPYGARRDIDVEKALAEYGVQFVPTGSPYAITPGRITKDDGSGYKVYSAFYRRWLEHGWRAPARVDAGKITWADPIDGVEIPQDPQLPAGLTLPEAGEQAALKAWEEFRRIRLGNYQGDRDRPDLDATSRLSPYLHFGSLHPRTLLDGLGGRDETFRKEIAWREFYAAVLHFWPESAREYFLPELKRLPYVSGAPLAQRLSAWQEGRTGYPIVDAGMRQLLAEGWMHNRVRMIVASFLVKDLQIEWTHGARYFMRNLVDADLASNQHGWQWCAGSGTDAAPYFRIFNPTMQGKKFDPQGDYIRRYVPELRSLGASEIHEPGLSRQGIPSNYPEPIVDHALQRTIALDAYQQIRK